MAPFACGRVEALEQSPLGGLLADHRAHISQSKIVHAKRVDHEEDRKNAADVDKSVADPERLALHSKSLQVDNAKALLIARRAEHLIITALWACSCVLVYCKEADDPAVGKHPIDPNELQTAFTSTLGHKSRAEATTWI
jgi:hypothetical protein